MSSGSFVLVVVPARRDSERLPLKPLVNLAGLPMVVRTFRQAQEGLRRSGLDGAVVVATDCPEIASVVEANGGNALQTKEEHASGTSRCREALDLYTQFSGRTPTWVVNVQGDEPLVNPDHVAALLRADGPLATLYTHVPEGEDLEDRSVCYVVSNARKEAQYFSRLPLPFQRTAHKPLRKRHLGVYAYTPQALRQIVQLAPAPEELAESLEQLRWLHHGFTISLVEVDAAHGGVDTAEDVQRVLQVLQTTNNP
jgi:3-deoxy-manno-octulosonate cytidylyltransferase (CMP-KDO synthetase)